jgi:hypothetical protein
LRKHRKKKKGTQTGLQQTAKWNKGHYFKNRNIWIKEDNTNCKTGVEQRYGKPQKKESNRNPGTKKVPLVKQKTHWKATMAD